VALPDVEEERRIVPGDVGALERGERRAKFFDLILSHALVVGGARGGTIVGGRCRRRAETQEEG
jgi:hypothetical protein